VKRKVGQPADHVKREVAARETAARPQSAEDFRIWFRMSANNPRFGKYANEIEWELDLMKAYAASALARRGNAQSGKSA
jgi:hypothetical protein